jgi:hypothetical protein
MGIWKARLMALLSMVAMLLALAAPVALADDDCELQRRGDQPDQVVCDGERFGVGQFVNQADLEGDDNDGDVDNDGIFDDEFDGLSLVGDDLGDDSIEIDDIDCDDIPDVDDEFFDEGLCVVSLDVFDEEVDVLVEAEEIFDSGEDFDF